MNQSAGDRVPLGMSLEGQDLASSWVRSRREIPAGALYLEQAARPLRHPPSKS